MNGEPIFDALSKAAGDKRLSGHAIRVLTVVCLHGGTDSEIVDFPSPPAISKWLGLSVKTVNRHLSTLEKHGYLQIVGAGHD